MIKYKDKKHCYGCSACLMACPVHAISMKRDLEGFLYPVISEKDCIDCHLCEKVCPALSNGGLMESSPICYAARAKDKDLRLNSSSGGIFSLLARQVLKEGGIVFGAAFSSDFFRVSHIAIETEAELYKLRGSKYLQSDIGQSYRMAKDYLKQGKKVLFSGTPCQISGLKSFLGKDESQLFTVSVICHGAPSPSIWSSYLSSILPSIRQKPSQINMRDKSSGWRKYNLSIISKDDLAVLIPANLSPYMKAFLKDYSLRPSCYTCECKTPVVSDITLGDFWGIETILPEMDDDKGTSLVIISTPTGKALFDSIDCEKRTVSFKDGMKHNPSLTKTSKYPRFRYLFFLFYRFFGFWGIKLFLRMKSFIGRIRYHK